jgi:hypothetical protein
VLVIIVEPAENDDVPFGFGVNPPRPVVDVLATNSPSRDRRWSAGTTTDRDSKTIASNAFPRSELRRRIVSRLAHSCFAARSVGAIQ